MGDREEVKLLGVWYSPYAIRPKIALRLKSVDYNYVEEDLFGSKSALLLKSNPVHKKVPVLLHKAKPIIESLNIVEYIDETWNSSGPSILPSDPHDRAIARFWSAFVDNKKAKAVRLRSHHDKYLVADEDEESVTQDRNGSAGAAKWTVEPVPGSSHLIRLKSAYGKYLTASNKPFLLGATGRKVLQTNPSRLDSSLAWEPIRDSALVKLKTRYGHYLRGNGGLPPWRNSVTHDIPHRSATQEWILWHVDVVEILTAANSDHQQHHHQPPSPLHHSDSLDFTPGSPSRSENRFFRQESTDSVAVGSPPKSEGRVIYYHVADDDGEVEDDSVELNSFTFKGNGVEELTKRLKEESNVEDVIVCTRSPLNGKLFPLRLQLPPNNADMTVVLVPKSSKIAEEFMK